MGFRIYAGLNGGFGGATYRCFLDTNDDNDAAALAYEMAVEEYQSYEGCHGLLSEYECAQELYGEGPDGEIPEWVWESDLAREDIADMYRNEIESWIDHYVVEADSEDEEE